jgi:hypothetical protein
MDIELMRRNKGSIHQTFDGSADNYTMLLIEFKVFANLNGFSEAICDESDPNMPPSWDSNLLAQSLKKANT